MTPQKKKTRGRSRRAFLKDSSAATLMTLLGGVELAMDSRLVQAVDAEKLHGPVVKCGVIGLGVRGREIASTLSRLAEAEVAAVCDTYDAALRRVAQDFPAAVSSRDYGRILANKDIKAVVIATPSHLHKAMTLAALEAGKHVYCEAPLAHTVEDARAIAKAAKNAPQQVFQSGLQFRSDPYRLFLVNFVHSGSLGKTVGARAQWHKKTSWRAAAASKEKQAELDWRLQKLSPGLIGEIGLHQCDLISWFLNARPQAVSGFGGVLNWNDGREVPDTIQAVFEFPAGANFLYEATLANSFDSEYEVLYGSESAVMLRQNKAWMFQEIDCAPLGWEVYARKETVFKETGIALVANATRLKGQPEKPVEQVPFTNTPLFYALQNFLGNVNEVTGVIEDFAATFNTRNKSALLKYLADNVKLQPAAGWQEGLESTIVGLKANEAILKKQRIVFEKEWFELA